MHMKFLHWQYCYTFDPEQSCRQITPFLLKSLLQTFLYASELFLALSKRLNWNFTPIEKQHCSEIWTGFDQSRILVSEPHSWRFIAIKWIFPGACYDTSLSITGIINPRCFPGLELRKTSLQNLLMRRNCTRTTAKLNLTAIQRLPCMQLLICIVLKLVSSSFGASGYLYPLIRSSGSNTILGFKNHMEAMESFNWGILDKIMLSGSLNSSFLEI